MRILKVVQAYYPFQEKGGPVVKVGALARGLAQRGHRVTVLTADLGVRNYRGAGVKFEACKWGWRSEQDGIEVIYLSTVGHYRAVTLNPRIAGFCRESMNRFDVAQIYGLYDWLGPAAGFFCRRRGVPYVLEPMGMFRPIVRNIALKRFYHGVFGNSLVAGARFLIATSEQERQELIEGAVAASRIVVRRNGIELPERLPNRGEFRRIWGIPEDARVVLFLGRVVSKKSPDLLLDAFSRWHRNPGNENSVLAIVGPDEGDGFLARLKMMARRLNLSRSVRFVGPLYETAKWQAYRDADVFVLPSQNENFGNTAVESAACGTPVIVTDQCGVARFVGSAGLVVPHDPRAIEEALAQLLGDPNLRARCEDGCAEMTRNLSWEGPLDQNEQLYARCVMRRTEES
ncbi:MAG TPA: glycosyltransferase [Candidatus Acidoferrales bacterium]|nr:glycosyltransferase [Candidatus Acidoferrales bacterium]